MKFLARWWAGGLTIYLAIYLLDSVLGPHFHLNAGYPAILAAVFLGLGNAFVKPLYRAVERPFQASVIACLTVLLNFLFLHLFVWFGDGFDTTSFAWVLLAAAFVALLTGTVNWLIGFRAKEKPRTAIRTSTQPEVSTNAKTTSATDSRRAR